MSSASSIPLPLPADTDFSLANIPFGVFTPPRRRRPLPAIRHICTAVGSYVVDLHLLAGSHVFADIFPQSTADESRAHPLLQPTLNALAALGRPTVRALRCRIREFVEAGGVGDGGGDGGVGVKTARGWPDGVLWKRENGASNGRLKMHVPFEINDYTDFYAGRHHAYNVGCLFRGPANALQANYLHLPVGYHGRASTIVVSGTDVIRPNGQLPPKEPGGDPRFGPTEKLDYELELAAFVGVGNARGEPIPVDGAAEHIFGYVLMNDWSARDIQAWEYVPLGPFLGKSFATSISPWVVTADALEGLAVEKPEEQNKLLPYLLETNSKPLFDFTLEVHLLPSTASAGTIPNKALTTTSPRHLIYSFPQMIAHHTINGCELRPGDLLGSGTISGPNKGEEGSLLEMSGNGKMEVEVGDGVRRRWVEDGDEVVLRGWGVLSNGERVGFGECRGRVMRARQLRL
ncbi:hypothetical protein BDZ91DRAFT_688003 [Kalaharituber pfeilii]|nr:hypothetical protein BDZ91DRAFT_688003 [Kalaharituber pfeilii]